MWTGPLIQVINEDVWDEAIKSAAHQWWNITKYIYKSTFTLLALLRITGFHILNIKGALCSFGEEIQTQNFDIYDINEVNNNGSSTFIIKVAGSATYKQSNTVWVVLFFKVSLFVQSWRQRQFDEVKLRTAPLSRQSADHRWIQRCSSTCSLRASWASSSSSSSSSPSRPRRRRGAAAASRTVLQGAVRRLASSLRLHPLQL